MADGKVVEGGVSAETTQTMKNVAAQLATVGAIAERRRQDHLLPHRHGELRRVQRGLRRRRSATTGRPARPSRSPASRPASSSRSRPGRTCRRRELRTGTVFVGARRRAQRSVTRTSPTTTTCGACPSATRACCSSSSSWKARRRVCRGRRSCASSTATAPPTDGSIPRPWPRSVTHDVERLLADAGIVRNRAKVDASIIGNARAWLELDDPVAFLWSFVDGAADPERMADDGWHAGRDRPLAGDEQGPQAARLPDSSARRSATRFMQATGMVNDHVIACFRHDECRALA